MPRPKTIPPIRTTQDGPHAWVARRKGNRKQAGFGPTRDRAIADLKRKENSS